MERKNAAADRAGGFNNRLFKIKRLIAVWVGKILIALTRVLGRGGTTLPGRAALKIEPRISASLAANLAEGSVIITGTNGKTTTAALLTGILQKSGLQCIHNQSGSNMSWGVASALIEASTARAALKGTCAVMEVDEGAFPGVVKSLLPRGVVITNVFRDQLDRYGEVDRIAESIRQGLSEQPAGSFQVINADDPSLAGIKTEAGKKRLFYGIEADINPGSFQNTGRDLKTCPQCGEKLNYDKIYFAHLGHYHCPACRYRRPAPDVKLTGYVPGPNGSAHLQIEFFNQNFNLNFILPGIYNLYNLLAAATCALAMEMPAAQIIHSLGAVSPAFGRMESFVLEGKKIFLALIKNPVGANEVLRTIMARGKNINLLVAINDKIADGTDVSWLWDVDFEQLVAVKEENLSAVLVSGLRNRDMAVRFKYAGLDPDRIMIEEKTDLALKRILNKIASGDTLYILPTYTAMLELRRHLNRMGLGKPYWEGQ